MGKISGKKALRDLSRHWRIKILCAQPDLLAVNHPAGEHGSWGHCLGVQQDTLPQHPSCSSSCTLGVRTKMTFPTDLASLLHPSPIPGTARAPLLLHLNLGISPSSSWTTTSPNLSASLAKRSPPRHLWGKAPSSWSCPNEYLQPLVGKEGWGCASDQGLSQQDAPRDGTLRSSHWLLPAWSQASCPQRCGEGEHSSEGA